MEQQQQQRSRWKPSVEVAPNCPRCASTNTKFCYYNNYSLSQPRYFCKGCRRYWTKGGSLRNVPVGGGCRKNRRGKSSRHHQSHRLSSTSDDRVSSSEDAHENNNKGSHDIDIALVFAKFLNPKPDTVSGEDDNNNGSSSTSNNAETETDAAVDQSQNKHVSSDPAISDNFDELERFLGVCGDEDGLWSDATTMSSWQSHAKEIQLHDLELEYSMDDIDDAQLLPFASTSWSSFDLSTLQGSLVYSQRGVESLTLKGRCCRLLEYVVSVIKVENAVAGFGVGAMNFNFTFSLVLSVSASKERGLQFMTALTQRTMKYSCVVHLHWFR
ncbi:hypothetical protein Fmac_007605 [Flemingia macrophylla]|uniref:Dof zinc finger protein n=1 Tax=Flemingia macrophylla TaxID=520843 RepID=A0ABD1MXB7_9FABA